MHWRGRGSYSSVEEGVTINRPIAKAIKLTLTILVEATGKSTESFRVGGTIYKTIKDIVTFVVLKIL